MKSEIRKEKICLNCGSEVLDRYCPHCGQENRDPKETFGELVRHFFADITHYDSKFFVSIKDLFLRPGYLTKEYLAGRRMRYLNPVRMYVFISFSFFLIYFSFFDKQDVGKDNVYSPAQVAKMDSLSRVGLDSALSTDLSDPDDSAIRRKVMEDTRPGGHSLLGFGMANLRTTAEFDSIQRSLPPSRRLGKVAVFFLRKWVSMGEEYGSRRGTVLLDDFKHNLPKMMFVLLPAFALLLKLFYSWKKYYYADHAIFSLHIHSFVFLFFLLAMVLDWAFHSSFYGDISVFIMLVYFIAALRNTYRQSVFLSIIKAFVIGLIYSIVLCLGLAFTGALTFITL